jgi:enoyl-CoA hydratase
MNNILVTIADGICTVTINRPDKMNALNIETIQEIGQAFDDIYSNDDIKAVVLTGAGEKAFVAGADIAEFANFSESEGKDMGAGGHDVFNKIENCPKPVVAAVNGFALGGGCELAMACHIRIASENAKFGQPEVNLGIVPGYGGTQRLPQLVGKGRAMELLMTGDAIRADRAEQIGLVNKVVPQEALMDEANSLVQKIMTKGPVAISAVIDLANQAMDSRDGFQAEIDAFGKSFSTEDFKEGTTAFVEKRKAEFKGK